VSQHHCHLQGRDEDLQIQQGSSPRGNHTAHVLDPSQGSSPPAGREDEACTNAMRRPAVEVRGGGGGASGSWIWEWEWRELSFIGTHGVKKGRNIDWRDWRYWTQKKIVKDSKHHLHISGVHLIAFECCSSNDTMNLSLFSLSLLIIYEWHGYHWQNDSKILFLVHLITQWFFYCFFLSFMCHQSDQSIFLCIPISLSFWVPEYFLLSHVINHTNQFLFPWEKNEERKQQLWLSLTFGKNGSGGYTRVGKNGVGEKNGGFRHIHFPSFSFFVILPFV
jgi:hypothetical protein